MLVFGGVYALRNIPLDAIPDQSDVQVIVYTEWAGQAPQTYVLLTDRWDLTAAEVV